MKVLVVINPVAGGSDKDIFISYLQIQFTKYDIDFKIHQTEGKDDEKTIKNLIDSFRPHRLLSVGGDGTVTICAKCIMGKDIALGIIPFGSANGMARELELSEDPEDALDDFLKSHLYRKLDLYKVNDKYIGMHIGDIGLNARIVEGYEKEEGRGMLSYAKHFLKELPQSELVNFSIELDNRQIDEKAYMIAFANARKYGSGVVLNWKGDLFDGKIEIVIARDINIRTLLLAGMTTLSEDLGRDDSLDIYSICKARIQADRPVSVQVDGEFIGRLDEVTIEVVPRAVKLILVDRRNQE
ncbi:MAG: diacylglycerol kinase [Cyclobacteriaceae bacterium]|nr:diacylglycerol kinase [Cyclobacteriaceae bacterium]